MDKLAFDLNSLKALDVLLREKHVSRAARALDVSQPAMSRALARLRKLFDDELLVRTDSGLALTARAEQLIEPVRRILTDAAALIRPPRFEPARITDEITVAALDIEMRLFLPMLLRRLNDVAPSLRLRAVQFDRGDFAMLDSGEADFILTAYGTRDGRYRQRLLFNDTRVVVMNSRLAKRLGNQLSLKAYTMLDHGLVSVEGRGEGLVDTALRVHGLKRRVMLHVPSFTLVPEICAARDLLFTLPYRITRTFPRSPKLVALPPPIAIDPPSFYIYWHARNHTNPLHAWFRKLVYECAASLDDDQALRNQPDTFSD